MHWLEKATLKRRREVLAVWEPAHHEPICDLAADTELGLLGGINSGSKPRVREARVLLHPPPAGYT